MLFVLPLQRTLCRTHFISYNKVSYHFRTSNIEFSIFFSLFMFLLSHLIAWTANSYNPEWLFSTEVSVARYNFLLISTCLILPCWLLSHLLVWLHRRLDTGAATSGARFLFGKKHENFFCLLLNLLQATH